MGLATRSERPTNLSTCPLWVESGHFLPRAHNVRFREVIIGVRLRPEAVTQSAQHLQAKWLRGQ